MAGFYDVKPADDESPLARKNRELRQMGTGEETPSPRQSGGGEPEPGSDAYLRRRDKQAEEDLKNAPRRAR